MTVTCPPGVLCGANVTVSTPQGQKLMVKVPAGIGPGDTFQVQVPAHGPSPTQLMMVTVPPGVKPGGSISIMAPSGQAVHVVVPAGVNEGGQFQVSVPVAAETIAVAAPVAPVAAAPVVAVPTGATITPVGGPPTQPGENVPAHADASRGGSTSTVRLGGSASGAVFVPGMDAFVRSLPPPGAPAGGQWMTVKYWGVCTWAKLSVIILLNVALPILFVVRGMVPIAVIVGGSFLFVHLFCTCGACGDCRLDKRTVYSIGGPRSKEQYDEHGRRVTPDCCGNVDCSYWWGAG